MLLTLQKRRVLVAKENLQLLAADLRNYIAERKKLRGRIADFEHEVNDLKSSLIQLCNERDALEIAWRRYDVPLQGTKCVNTDEAAVFRRGREWVYAYAFPAHENLAHERRQRHYPIKIGMSTQESVVARVHQHVSSSSTALSERAVLRLVFRVNGAGNFEKWIHEKLSRANRQVTESVGVEWFQTNPTEVERLFRSDVLTHSRGSPPVAGAHEEYLESIEVAEE